jgi:hypothetical protein
MTSPIRATIFPSHGPSLAPGHRLQAASLSLWLEACGLEAEDQAFSTSRLITSFWISLVPSPMVQSLLSR